MNGQKHSLVSRIIHLTDIHLQDELSVEDLSQCFEHFYTWQQNIDLILNGGDVIMDGIRSTKELACERWKLWREFCLHECNIPMLNCLGNHDIWGGGSTARLFYGKEWALDELELENAYYYHDIQNWRIIVLDSILPCRDWYIGKLAGPQYEWLESTVQSTPSGCYILILSHIPILSAAVLFDGNNEQEGYWKLPPAWLHLDARKLVALFHRYPKVRLCLSGHTHLRDEVIYNDVHYCSNGSVCGEWWRDPYYHETPAGYAVIELFDDGSFTNNYIQYKWKRECGKVRSRSKTQNP